MKTKLMAAILAVALMAGCGDGFNQTKLRQAVIEEMKSPEVLQAPGNDYKYIVRTTDGAVWFVECMGKDAKITAKAQLFPPTK